MKDWEKRQNHHNAITQIMTKHNCMDSKGLLRASKPIVYKELERMGHNSLDFDQCECKFKL